MTPAESPAPTSLPEELKPRWLEDELLLVRTASLDGEARLQGLWLDWPKLRGRLLETIKDLLPNAELSPTDPAWLDASSMVTLPVRLLPGHVDLAMSEASPLRRSLTIAWACFFIAATAVGIVLNRAMVLSERRGAFVSAVTHELRTPLTTFQLYSEMLADDMVPDADKRREYLRTLCDESTRLTHLVENVLSYSRIERGRASARRETLLLSDLIARIEPRLRQRTQPTGLDLQISVAPEAAETRVNVDALAVEQIVFNLVDNACKYAAPASKEKALRVEVSVDPKHATIRVRDHGPGLSKQQLKRLFRPFEKSATEAAQSAPGVGLGLALCRRLARELGGELALESSDAGACFKFTMPRAEVA
jgi:signal transduction histidine kinase